MEKLLVYQHAPHEHGGTFLEVARMHGIRTDIVTLWKNQEIPDTSQYSRLLIMGGPQSAYDPIEQYPSRDAEIYTIKDFAEKGKPVLGVCLGSQLVAHAFDGRVYKNSINGKPYKETGFYSVKLTDEGKLNPLFQGFPDEFDVFHWHGDVFDLPEKAVLLATGDNVPNQAFVNGTVYATLFHLEFTPRMVEELIRLDNAWLHRDNNVDEKSIVREAYEKEQVMRTLSEKLFVNWLNV